MARKSFKEKYETASKAQVKETDKGIMVIPATYEYDELMKQVPEGKVMLLATMREVLAEKHKADFACPLVTGIFTNIIANKAEEDMSERGMNIDEITPYWRTLKADGELNLKYPGGVEEQAAKLRKEGLKIEKNKKGDPKKVADAEDNLFTPKA